MDLIVFVAAGIVLIPLGYAGPSLVAFQEIRARTGSAAVGAVGGAVAAGIIDGATLLRGAVVFQNGALVPAWAFSRGSDFRSD